MIKARTVKAYGAVHHTVAVHTPLYRSSSFSLGDNALRIVLGTGSGTACFKPDFCRFGYKY